MFIPIWTETAFSPTEITVFPLRYQPKLPVENAFTSASISWPLMEIFNGSAFSMNRVSDTGHEVLGGMRPHSHQKPAGSATLVLVRIAVMFACLLAACGSNHGTPDGHGGNGDGGNGDGNNGNGDGGGQCGALTAIFRDFQASHPDFEATIATDRGLVKTDLGSDNKPVYAPAGATATVSGQASFDQWYRDVGGVNMHFEQPLPLVEAPPGTFTFEDGDFFPLDGMGFGNEGNPHNFHFTTEIHTTFKYRGGEVFSFTGDDDVFVFVNKKLGIDLGGVHGVQSATIDFDMMAGPLGISVGNAYQLDVFHAERHTSASNFRMVTTIDCFIIQ